MTTIATTDQKKARLLDLTTGILEMTRDGNRDIDEVLDAFQLIKENPDFATFFGRPGRPVAPKLEPPLLEEVGTIVIPAMTEQFVAREEFVLNYGPRAKPGLRIAYVESELLDVIEEPVAETTLRYARLTRSSLDGPILKVLGNRQDIAVLLRQIRWLMSQQPSGESGTFLNDGRANIFYRPGLLRAVNVFWRAGLGGWVVSVGSVTSPDGWYVGSRVFSCNSSVAVVV